MYRVDTLKTIISVSVLSLFVGCSNLPVSVSHSNPTEVAALNSIRISDLGAYAGYNTLWGIDIDDRVSGTDNYYIYKFDGSNWSKAPGYHYGKCIAVGATGVCFHVNTDNQIWWGDGSNAGFLTNGTDLTTISDIGTAYSTYHWVWITGTTSGGTKKVWRCNITNLIPNDVSTGYWQDATVGVPSPVQIYCDPYNGYGAIAVTASGAVYVTTDSGITWYLQSYAGTCASAAMCGNNIVVKRNSPTSAIWKGVIGQTTSYSLVTAGGGDYLAACKSGSTYYIYYTDDSYATRATF